MKRINKYYGVDTWEKIKDMDKYVFIKDGAHKLYKLKKAGLLLNLKEIGAFK